MKVLFCLDWMILQRPTFGARYVIRQINVGMTENDLL